MWLLLFWFGSREYVIYLELDGIDVYIRIYLFVLL